MKLRRNFIHPKKLNWADPNIEQAWLEEAQRRNRELIEGKVEEIPGEKVFKNLRSRLRK